MTGVAKGGGWGGGGERGESLGGSRTGEGV